MFELLNLFIFLVYPFHACSSQNLPPNEDLANKTKCAPFEEVCNDAVVEFTESAYDKMSRHHKIGTKFSLLLIFICSYSHTPYLLLLLIFTYFLLLSDPSSNPTSAPTLSDLLLYSHCSQQTTTNQAE